MAHATRVGLAVSVAGAMLVAGCTVPEETSQDEGPVLTVSPTVLDADGDRAAEWVVLTLSGSPGTVVPWEATRLWAAEPGGGFYEIACHSAVLAPDGSCQRPFGPGDGWGVGASLYMPCLRPSEIMVSVYLSGHAELKSWAASCDAGAQGSAEPPMQGPGPENASITARGMDGDADGANEWIRLTLTRGENAPYSGGTIAVTVVYFDGTDTVVLTSTAEDGGPDHTLLCNEPTAGVGASDCDSAAAIAFADTWDVGSTLFLPCQAGVQHALTVTIRETSVLDTRVNCDAAAIGA